jgi:hypothetical protein
MAIKNGHWWHWAHRTQDEDKQSIKKNTTQHTKKQLKRWAALSYSFFLFFKTFSKNIHNKHRHYTTALTQILFVHTFSIQTWNVVSLCLHAINQIHSLFKDICHQILIYLLYIIIYTLFYSCQNPTRWIIG